MGKSKKKVRARKVKSTGVWIAPDLERKIKGEGGRRGLSEPPYSYYLHLADLALKTSPPIAQPSGGAQKTKADDPREIWQASSSSTPGQQESSGDWIPAPQLPIHSPPRAPKLAMSKPPRNPLTPKPAKRAVVNPLQRPSPKKLRLPKPPKRSR